MAQEALGGLFGPTESEIRQLIDEKGRADINTLYNNAPSGLRIAGANMAQSGRMLGGALETLSGYVDPRVDKARKMEMVKQSVLSTGVSPDSDPIEFAKLSAREFARMGLGDEAFGAAMYAKQMQDEMAATEWEKEAKRGDWQNRLDVERMRGEYDLSVAGMRGGGNGSGGGFGGGAPKAYDQNEAKAFAEQFMRSPQARALFQKPGILYGTNLDEEALQVEADAFGRDVETLITLGMPAGVAWNTAMSQRTIGRGNGNDDATYEARALAIRRAPENQALLDKYKTEEEKMAYARKAARMKPVETAAPPEPEAKFPEPPRTAMRGGVSRASNFEVQLYKWKDTPPNPRTGYPAKLKEELKSYYSTDYKNLSPAEQAKFRAFARSRGVELPK